MPWSVRTIKPLKDCMPERMDAQAMRDAIEQCALRLNDLLTILQAWEEAADGRQNVHLYRNGCMCRECMERRDELLANMTRD